MNNDNLCGLEINSVADLSAELKLANSYGFTFITANLFHPKETFVKDSVIETSHIPSTRSDVVFHVNGDNIARSIVGRVSSWIDPDSTRAIIRKKSEKALERELAWASHLSLPAVSIRLRKRMNVNLTRVVISHIMKESCYTRIWLVIPLHMFTTNDSVITEVERLSLSPKENTWNWWNDISSLASDVIDNLSVALIITENLPDNSVISRWLSEPVACLFVPTSLFITNSKGYPILSKPHQSLIKRFFKIKSQIVITGDTNHHEGYKIYQKYMTWLFNNSQKPDLYDEQSNGLEDQIQEPLQPLKDNLSSATYSIFEMDPYKYTAYEDAICKALFDLNNNYLKRSGSINLSKPHKIVVMILGAGRGPLVTAALNASEKSNIPIRVYIIEKNPNAVFTLQDKVINQWVDYDVHLLPGDMREQTPPEKADLFISELLGSFGDNELSPECLDGAQKYLADGGISIPSSYTSYLSPIQSLKIYRETSRQPELTAVSRITIPSETPYVVRLLNCQILNSPKPAFEFSHPRENLNESNERFVSLSFDCAHDCTVHGFAGFFDCVLYDDITMSIHPEHHSPDLISWFPLVFPIDRPLTIKAGERITIHMWRCISSRDVWYEWALTEPRCSKVFNASGRAYKMSL